MTGRLNPVLAFAAAALLAAPSMMPSGSLAAQDPYRVLIPDFHAKDGQDRGFGQGVAGELGKLIDNVPGYLVIDRGEVQDQLRKYQLKMEDLDCTKSKQLASLMGNVKLTFCGAFESQGENRVLDEIQVWDKDDTAPFTIPGFSVGRQERKPAADKIHAAFDRFTQQLKATAFCLDYFDSNDWEQALRNCNQALEINPGATGTLFLKAEILRQLQRFDEALTAVAQVITADPLNEEALQMGGFLATQLGRNQQARGYYQQYLDLNPGDNAVRLRIAGEIAQAGDPEGAMIFIEPGLANAPNDEVLLLAHGGYAFAAASKAAQTTPAENSSGPSAQVSGYYRKAIEDFQKLFDIRGAQMEVDLVWNIMKAQMMLQDFPQAIASAEKFMPVYPTHAGMVFDYYVSLERAGRIDDAIAALRKLETIQADYPDLHFRLALMLLSQNKLDEALPVFVKAVNTSPAPGAPPHTADQLSDLVFAEAGKALNAKDWSRASEYLAAAKKLPVSQDQAQKLTFYQGYIRLQQAGAILPDPNKGTLEGFCRSLPIYEDALRILESSRGPWAARTNPPTDIAALTGPVTQLVDFEKLQIRNAEAVGSKCPAP